MRSEPKAAEGDIVKQCCARLYESDFAKILLGDSFHPGGLRLTERLGVLLDLTAESRVLDAASGKGASAIYLAERFGCRVVGIDYSGPNIEAATELAKSKGLATRVRFQSADAERIDFPDASFDAVICECAFCTFPDKAAVAKEFARVLRPGGKVGLSDLTRGPQLPQELEGLLAVIACIAEAKSIEEYGAILRSANFGLDAVELHDDALAEMVQGIRAKLLGLEALAGLKKLDLPGVDVSQAQRVARSALGAVQQGQLGYAIITGHL